MSIATLALAHTAQAATSIAGIYFAVRMLGAVANSEGTKPLVLSFIGAVICAYFFNLSRFWIAANV